MPRSTKKKWYRSKVYVYNTSSGFKLLQSKISIQAKSEADAMTQLLALGMRNFTTPKVIK